MYKSEKFTGPSNFPIGGMMMSSTKDDTIFPKAAPIMTPTARSRTFPRMANSLNSLSTVFSFAFQFRQVAALHESPDCGRAVCCTDYIGSELESKGREEGCDL